MWNTLKAATLESKFPLLAVEANRVTSENVDITAVFGVELPELFAVAVAEYETIHAAWARATKVLPNYTMVHKQDWLIRKDYRSQTDKENLSFLSRSYRMHFNEHPFLNHKCYLYLTKTTKRHMRMQSSFSPLCRGFIVPREMDKDTTAHFLDTVGQFVRIMNDTGLAHLRRLVDDEITGTEDRVGLVEKYLCLSTEDTTVLENIELGDGGLRVGDKHISVHALSELDALSNKVGTGCRYERLSTDKGDYKLSSANPVGLLLSYSHLYSQYTFLDDSGENLQHFEESTRNTRSLSEYSRSNQINKEWIDLYLSDTHSLGFTSIRTRYSVIAWTNNPMEVKNMRNSVGSQIVMMECKPHHNTVNAATLYRAAIPRNGADFPTKESFYTFIEQTLRFWVEETNYCSSVSPFELKMLDRISEKPLHVDISDLPIKRGVTTNQNKLVLGGSSNGKSFFMSHLTRQYYEQGTHVVLIDAGDNYRGLCSLIYQKTGDKDDTYFAYTNENPVAFNPFFADDRVFDIEKRESIKTLILTLQKKGNEPATHSEEVALSNAVALYIRRIKKDEGIAPSFDTFYESVKTDYREMLEEKGVRGKDFDLAGFLNMLEPYHRDGEYDSLLNSNKQLDLLGKWFIIFGIDQIKDHPILFPITTIIIMELFINKICRLEGMRKMIITEETWKAVVREGMTGYIRYLLKTVRELYGETVAMTQEVDDITSSPIAKGSTVNNNDCEILLDQRKYLNEFSQIRPLLGLTDKERAQILPVSMSNNPKRKYKEVWLRLGGVQSAVYATEISLGEYPCYTAKESEKVEMEQLAKQLDGNIKPAIRRLAEKRRSQSNGIP